MKIHSDIFHRLVKIKAVGKIFFLGKSGTGEVASIVSRNGKV